MQAYPGNGTDLVLDCVQRLASSHLFIRGWVCWAPDRPAPTIEVVRDGAPLPTLLFSTHARPDIVGMPLGSPEPLGFFLVVHLAGARAADGLEVSLRAGADAASVALPPTALGPALPDLIGHVHWRVAFDLFDAVAGDRRLDGLLKGDRQAFGAFARWIDALPVLPAAADDQHGLRRIDAIAAPSGECAVAVTLPALLAEGTALRVVAALPTEGGVRLHRLAGPAALRGDAFLALYGRLPAEVALPAPAPDLVVELLGPDGGSWFRVTPRSLPAPVFLETLRSLVGGGAAGDMMHGFAWLRGVLEDREAELGRLARPALRALPPDAPVIAVLHAVDDAFAARLALLAAAQVEARAAEVLVVGPPPAAEAVADVFLQRGRVPARTSFDLAATVRRGTYARCALVPIDMLALGDALVGDTMDALFAHRLDGAALPALLRLAAVAGTMDGAQMLGRVAQVLDSGAGSLRFGRSDSAFGQVLNQHLAGFWRDAAPAFATLAVHGPA